AHAGEEIILEETIASPGELQFAAKHVEHKHIGEDVPDGRSIVQEQVGERLPDAQAVGYAGRYQPKSVHEPTAGGVPGKCLQQDRENVSGYIGDQQPLDPWRNE